MPYEDSLNKAAIRVKYNLPTIAQFASGLGRSLDYFGLTGPKIKDVVDWRKHLRYVTAVESLGRGPAEREQANRVIASIMTNAMVHNLSSGFQVLRADVEKVILNGYDSDGNAPQQNDGQPAEQMRFQYDVINLDFDGGLCYVNGKTRAARLESLRHLFVRQSGHPFLLFLTINVRDTLKQEPHSYLKNYQDKCQTAQAKELLGSAVSLGSGNRELLLKPLVVTLLKEYAELNNFTLDAMHPVFYVGHKDAHMVHFSFRATPSSTIIRGFSNQSVDDLVLMPLLRVEAGSFEVDPFWLSRGIKALRPDVQHLIAI